MEEGIWRRLSEEVAQAETRMNKKQNIPDPGSELRSLFRGGKGHNVEDRGEEISQWQVCEGFIVQGRRIGFYSEMRSCWSLNHRSEVC